MLLMPIIILALSISYGLFLYILPAAAIDIQKKFYRIINWNIEPISMQKEIRNTKIMGVFLIAATVIIFILAVRPLFAQQEGEDMKLTSPAFGSNGFIPAKYSGDGKDINPELVIENIPEETKSLALIVDDPDAPVGVWVHWIVYDIAPDVKRIAEDSIPGKQGVNDFNRKEYGGPQSPSGTHHYYFKVYAIDKELGLEEGVTKKELEEAMEGHILGKAELVGLYKAR